MRLSVPFSFDWNKDNIDKNWKKHKVLYREAEEVFFNKPLLVFPDIKHSTTEGRFQTLGITNDKRKLSIFFTIRENKIRVISARDQNKKERRKYG